jgi:diketogulonate reductase-like aldo/keto reductase
MPIAVHSVAEARPLIDGVRAAAVHTVQVIIRLTASEPDVLEVLRQMKFAIMAWHPLEDCADCALNLIEEISERLYSIGRFPWGRRSMRFKLPNSAEGCG